MVSEADFVVVGGGMVGLATAHALLRRRPNASLILIEKEDGPARHQSGHNSGVVHAGIYYEPGSLKAKLCRAGAAWTKQFCLDHSIPCLPTGKLIVAATRAELPGLADLAHRAEQNQIEAHWLDAGELRSREPAVAGHAALYLPQTAVVDYPQVAAALAEEVAAMGGMIRFEAEVCSITETPTQVLVGIRRRPGGEPEQVRAGRLVVCGGLQADRLARMSGVGGEWRVVGFRGEYYQLVDCLQGLVSTLIYPVPDASLPFLGVHLTLTTDGRITVGPNAVLSLAREGYRKGSLSLADTADLARFPGFWRLAATNLRTGIGEQFNSWVKAGYLRQVQKYCPQLRAADLIPAPAGIRAQVVRRDGRLVNDFVFGQTDRTLHVCNAPSPAATSAMPIAELVSDRLLGVA